MISRSTLAAGLGLVFLLSEVALVESAKAAAPADPTPIRDEYVVSRFRVDDGLPEGVITSIQQLPDGFVWLTTPGSVVRFDGVEFAVLPQSEYPAAKPKRFNSIIQDRHGMIWVSGEDGVMRHDGKRWAVIAFEGDISPPQDSAWMDTPDGEIKFAPGLNILWVREGIDGTIWAATNGGMFRFESDRFTPVMGTVGRYYTSVAMLEDGSIWMASKDGLSAFDGQRCRTESFPSEDERGRIFQIFAGAGKRLWGKRLDGKLFGWANQQWTEIPPAGLRLASLFESEPGDVWIGAAEGLFHLNQEGWTVLTGLPVESPADVRCITKTADGSLLVGTSAGIYQLRRRLVGMVGCPTASNPRHAVTAVVPKGGNELWVGINERGLLKGHPNRLQLAPEVSDTSETFVSTLMADCNGTLWAGFLGNHLWRLYPNGTAQQFRSINGVASRNATSMLQDRNKRIWVGTREGLGAIKEQWWQPVQPINDTVLALCEDPTGSIWAGTQSAGLWQVSSKRVVGPFGVKDGLPSNMIRSLHCDDQSVLWIGSNAGLARWDLSQAVPGSSSDSGTSSKPRVFSFSRQQGLPSNDIRQVLDDGKGGLWIGTRQEICRIAKTELLEVAQGHKVAVNLTVFGREEGLEAELVCGDHGPLTARLADGTLWFATKEGLARIDPKKLTLPDEQPPPSVFIEEISSSAGQSREPARQLADFRVRQGKVEKVMPIAPGTRTIEFKFNSPCYAAPSRTHFKYMLEGFESNWSQPTGERSAIYSRLPPGTYRFRVMACNANDVWSETEDRLRIEVEPFFWQTWWFSGGIALIGLVMVGSASGAWVRHKARKKLKAERLRSQEREQALERERALEQERARIAKDIHDDIGASLTRILLQSKSARNDLNVFPQRLPQRLNAIEATAVEMTRVMDEIVWAVNPRNDTLDGLVTYLGRYAEEFLKLAGIRCRMALPLDLPARPISAKVRHGLFLAFKEALNNTAKHAGAAIVRISVRTFENWFEIIIEDDGKGFAPGDSVSPTAECGQNATRATGGGHGLGNMQTRLAQIGGQCEIEGLPGKGVSVRFRIYEAKI